MEYFIHFQSFNTAREKFSAKNESQFFLYITFYVPILKDNLKIEFRCEFIELGAISFASSRSCCFLFQQNFKLFSRCIFSITEAKCYRKLCIRLHESTVRVCAHVYLRGKALEALNHFVSLIPLCAFAVIYVDRSVY